MASAQRNGTIDLWRGAALLTIFVNHIPGNILEAYTHRNFGFSDGAEAFVFLAGLSLALAYYPRLPGGALLDVAWRCARRAFHLYKVHLLLTFAALAMFALVGLDSDAGELLDRDGRGEVFHDTGRALAGMLLLGHQIGYFDILPMYVALLLWAPLAFALVRVHPALALGASAAIYALARLEGLAMPSWPAPGTWYFNPFAWQFLFTLGILAGVAASGRAVPSSRPALALSALVVAGSALAATDLLGLMPGLWHGVIFSLDIDKSNLGLARLVHFLALAYLLSQLPLGAWLAGTEAGREVARLGRQALPVFAVGSFLSVLGQVVMTLSSVKTSASPALVGMIFTLFGAMGLFLLARYLEWLSPQRARVPASASVPPSPSSSLQPLR